jgi:hypothetical protein
LSDIRTSFEKDGFVIVRGAVPSTVVDELFMRFPRTITWVTAPLEWLFSRHLRQFATLDGLWVLDDAFWLIWRRSNIPQIVSTTMEAAAFDVKQIRLLTDYVVGIKGGGQDPEVFGKFHQDSTSFDIIDTAGISVWLPLQDIDITKGGSLVVISKSEVDADCLESDHTYSIKCLNQFQANQHLYSFGRGDLLVFSHTTIHKTQPLLKTADYPWRYAMIGRIFAADSARYKTPKAGPPQRKNSCVRAGESKINVGDHLQSACFPVIWPRPEAVEDSARDQGQILRDSRITSISKMISGFLSTPDYY